MWRPQARDTECLLIQQKYENQVNLRVGRELALVSSLHSPLGLCR